MNDKTYTIYNLRLSEADAHLCEQIREALGASKSSEVLRMGLHCLARREGLKTPERPAATPNPD